MPTDPRLADLARAIQNHTLHPADIPVYDRPGVQELLLVWWLERGMRRRVSAGIPTPSLLPLLRE